jgi:glutamate dehydrogenase/leucine dehydrogenase
LDEIGATGFGLAICAEAIAAAGVVDLAGARVAIQGFGAVGSNVARFLAARGATIVAVADVKGAVVNPVGFDLHELVAWKASGRSVAELPDGEQIARDDIMAADCEFLVPAARGDAIHEDNVERVKARVVLPGANIAVTPDAEVVLHDRGVLVMPDFIANAGGAICASIEYRGGTEAQSFAAIEERIRANAAEVLEIVADEDVLPRQAAEQMARRRVESARRLRRKF